MFSQLIEEVQPDIVNINGCWLPENALIQRCAQRKGCKVVITPHGMLEPWILKRHYWTRKFPALALYQKKTIQNANCILSTAKSECDNILKLGYNNNVHVIGLGLDTETIKLRTDWKQQKKILFLSRIHVKKGIEFLVQAVDSLRNELNGWKIIIAGEGDAQYIEQLKKIIAEKKLEHIFDFIGGVYGEQKWKIYQSADFFVLPTYSENFGYVIAEALASGTPVITTKGTPWQDIETYHCGKWIDVGSKPLSEAIQQMIKLTDAEREAMGQNARKLIEEKYSAKVMAEKIMELYKSL